MNLLRFELISEDDLLARLKMTRLKGFDQRPIYEAATLAIEEAVDPESLTPAQRYVLAPGIRTLIELQDAFQKEGIDIFALRGGLMFWTDEEDGPIPFTPPIVEDSHERDGNVVRLINDGIHRVYAAKKLGRRLNIVHARNVPVEYPYYAYALADGWAGVQEIEELHEGFEKKEYRMPENYKALFRNFNEVLPGVQKQRKETNPKHLVK